MCVSTCVYVFTLYVCLFNAFECIGTRDSRAKNENKINSFKRKLLQGMKSNSTNEKSNKKPIII